MKRITHLYYKHDERKVVDQDNEAVALKRAKKVFEAGTLTDFNLAMRTLAIHDYNMNDVDAHYKALDKLRA